MTSRFPYWATLPSSMLLHATPRRTVNRFPDATPTAGQNRTDAGSRCPRMCRGDDSLSLPGLTRQSISLQKNLAKINGCAGRLARRRASRFCPRVTTEQPSSIKHDDAAHRLAGLHRRKAFVDFGQFQLRRDPVLQMQLAAHVKFDQAGHVDAEM